MEDISCGKFFVEDFVIGLCLVALEDNGPFVVTDPCYTTRFFLLHFFVWETLGELLARNLGS